MQVSYLSTASGRKRVDLHTVVLRSYIEHYNSHRPHRALGLRPPDLPQPLMLAEAPTVSNIHRRDVLGGLLHEYQLAA